MVIETFARLRARVRGRWRPVTDHDDHRPLFVHLEISRLNRLAFIVVRGNVTMAAARATLRDLEAANVPAFAKIIDLSGMSFERDESELRRLAALVRRASSMSLGRVALVVDREHDTIGKSLAEWVADDSRVAVLRSLHQARVFVNRKLDILAEDVSEAAD